MTTNAYSFLPWLRAGIATRIATDPGAAKRATVLVSLQVTGDALAGGTLVQPVERAVQLYGPGDVVGVDQRAISRTEPRPGVTNVEPNYLAHIEFSDEDFVWRYSPAAADGDTKRLAPWLALVVLAAPTDLDGGGAEFTEGASAGGPLPVITVTNPVGTLPPPDQLGAWAHVHVNGSLDNPVATDDTVAALAVLAEVLRTNPDNACSRLICPRRLRPDTGYEAFLVPAFETGRLAGLGRDPAVSPSAVYSSWGPHYPDRPAEGQLPYYHRWSFRTGTTGDFEFLVRLLRPQPADRRIGRRDLDVHRSPGLGLPGIDSPPELPGVLPLGGALKVPEVPGAPVDPAENWDNFLDTPPSGSPYPHPFEQSLAKVVNLADDYQGQTPSAAHAAIALTGPAAVLADPTAAGIGAAANAPAASAGADPIITPPLYGRWHALTSRLLTHRDGTPVPAPANHNWVHRLNLDPRFRVAANLGGQVVRARDEDLMAAAWAQVGDVLVANAKIRAAQLAREVGHVLQTRHVDPPQGGTPSALAAAPAAVSARSLTLTAPAHSRLTTTAADLSPTSVSAHLAGLSAGLATDLGREVAVGFRVATSRVAAAPVSPAMRRITRPGSRLMRSLRFSVDQPPAALLSRMDSEIDPVTAAAAKATPAALVTPARLEAVLHPGQDTGVDPVARLPHSPDFVLRAVDDPVAPHPGATDSPEAIRFKTALRELYDGVTTAVVVGRTERRPPLGVVAATSSVLAGLRADETVPKTLLGSVSIPDRLQPFAAEFIEAMAYPVFDLPTYQALLDLSVDAFVPNLSLLPANSITLLANNREFIESYLVGLNHEMARELLWREYPTDQRGTPFRQFWDPVVALPQPGESPEQRRERRYDIPAIHRWPLDGQLGHNRNQQHGGPEQDGLVLVVRGELLKKYPTTAIYAQKAEWPIGPDGPDLTQERVLVTLPDEGPPSPEQVLLPAFEAKIEPDIYLLGFDLTAATALGSPPDDAGWFFVLKERPGDPRFGLDDAPPTDVEVWNDLTWNDVDPHRRGFLELDPAVTVALAAFDGSPDDPEKQEQRVEDENLPLWFAGLSSADLAYILFQVPVLVAVHAQEMLPR